MKSGEELQDLFTSPNALFIGVCEGWVKSEDYFNKFFTCTFSTTIKLQLYDYTCYGCTTIDFPQHHHLVKKSQASDYQHLSDFLHIYDILKEITSVRKYENLRQANVKKIHSQ